MSTSSSSTKSTTKPVTKKAKTDKTKEFFKAAAADMTKMREQHSADMAKMREQHSADMVKMQEGQDKMKSQIEQMQRILVDKLGGGEKRTASGEVKKQRKKIEYCNNYYLLASEFFSRLCPLIGQEKMRALGKINAWGNNKEVLKTWFKENGLDLSNKLNMEEIRDIITKKNLIEAFTAHFTDLAASIKGLKKEDSVEEETASTKDLNTEESVEEDDEEEEESGEEESDEE